MNSMETPRVAIITCKHNLQVINALRVSNQHGEGCLARRRAAPHQVPTDYGSACYEMSFTPKIPGHACIDSRSMPGLGEIGDAQSAEKGEKGVDCTRF